MRALRRQHPQRPTPACRSGGLREAQPRRGTGGVTVVPQRSPRTTRSRQAQAPGHPADGTVCYREAMQLLVVISLLTLASYAAIFWKLRLLRRVPTLPKIVEAPSRPGRVTAVIATRPRRLFHVSGQSWRTQRSHSWSSLMIIRGTQRYTSPGTKPQRTIACSCSRHLIFQAAGLEKATLCTTAPKMSKRNSSSLPMPTSRSLVVR